MASIRPQIAATPVPLRETAQQKMARQQIIRSKQMFNRPVKQLKSAIPPLGSPVTPEIAARNKALQTPIQQTTATLAPGMKSTAVTPQMSPEKISQMDAQMLGVQVKPAQTKPPKDYSGAPSAAQVEADSRRMMAMAEKQAQTATPSQAPPDTAMPAVMAKGGMVKKPAAKKMAKGGVVIKANCGASVPPTQKYKK